MTAQAIDPARPMRFAAARMPAVIPLGVFAAIAQFLMFMVLGTAFWPSIFLLCLGLAIGPVGWVVSYFENRLELLEDHLFVSIWVYVPAIRRSIRYSAIDSVTLDEDYFVTIHFHNEAGEREQVPFRPLSTSDRTVIRDAIDSRRRGNPSAFSKTRVDVLSPLALPKRGEKLRLAVEVPGVWSIAKWVVIVAPFISAAGLIAHNDFSILKWIVFTLVVLVVTPLISLLAKRSGRVEVYVDRITVAAGAPGDFAKIEYSHIVHAEGSETGWLQVDYRHSSLLDPSIEPKSASARLKQHELAPALAASLLQAREDALKAQLS